MAKKKFSGRFGFIMSAAGSSVGLGNIWRFPYLTARYGGGGFLLIYIILVLTFGFTLLAAEIALGRLSGKTPPSAFSMYSKKYAFVGYLSILVAFLVLQYYCVVVGWIIRYLLFYLVGKGAAAAAPSALDNIRSSLGMPVMIQFLFTVFCGITLAKGVRAGIEKVNVILMPILIALTAGIALYSLSLDGAAEGLKFYLYPRLSSITPSAVVAALGQMFYSLTLAAGVMVTYGSYLPKSADIESCITHVEVFDTGIAILSGLMIIPAVFACFGNSPEVLSQGTGLMFVTMPKVFELMPAGSFIAPLFFLLVLFAAFTSATSLMEACIASICERFSLPRKKSVIWVCSIVFLLSIIPAMSFNVAKDISFWGMNLMDTLDYFTNSVLMLIAAFFTCIYTSRKVGADRLANEISPDGHFRRGKLFRIILRYIAPVLILVIFISQFF